MSVFLAALDQVCFSYLCRKAKQLNTNEETDHRLDSTSGHGSSLSCLPEWLLLDGIFLSISKCLLRSLLG